MDADSRVLELSGKQFQVISYSQAIECGLTPGQIRHRLDAGRFIRIHRRTYRICGSDPTAAQLRAMAASLAVPGAWCSHMTAVALWKLCPSDDGPVHLTIPASRCRRLPNIVIHRTALLGPYETGSLGQIPIASAARTLLDVSGLGCLEQLVNSAFNQKLVRPKQLMSYLSQPRLSKYPGSSRLRKLVRKIGLTPPESELERLLDDIYRNYQLPGGVRQFELVLMGRAIRLDRAHPERHLAVEVDGHAYHSGRSQRQRDHERQNLLEAQGWRVIRFTWQHVTQQPDYVALTIARCLGLTPAKWRRKADR